jgi:hypothetical protein
MRRNKLLFICSLVFTSCLIHGQDNDENNLYLNSAERMLQTEGNLTLGGYGEVHYNQPVGNSAYNNGSLDVHRLVMLLGYRFNDRTQFVSEIEFEHVSEVYIEQAFLQYKLNNFINVRGGLLLIPMGIINEYHEPTTFNGVERPVIDSKIAPTTWREIGVGFAGNIIPATIRYQAYLVNGFNGYNGEAKLNGNNGLRGGRQKGAESYISAPNFTGKVEFYGIRGLNLGISAYFGKTQSTRYNGIDKNDSPAIASADSSVVGVSMLGIDARYSISAFQFRSQYYLTNLSNSTQYNYFTASGGVLNDLGSSMGAFYLEAGYDVFHLSKSAKSQLVPFIRYETYNTHRKVGSDIAKNPAYKNEIITAGITWKITNGAAVKTDMQFVSSGSDNTYSKIFNAGIGVMF